MIVQLNALRIREIEMSRGEFMLMNHPQDQLFRTTREKLDRAGIRCVSYYSATIKDEQDVEDAVSLCEASGMQQYHRRRQRGSSKPNSIGASHKRG